MREITTDFYGVCEWNFQLVNATQTKATEQ